MFILGRGGGAEALQDTPATTGCKSTTAREESGGPHAEAEALRGMALWGDGMVNRARFSWMAGAGVARRNLMAAD